MAIKKNNWEDILWMGQDMGDPFSSSLSNWTAHQQAQNNAHQQALIQQQLAAYQQAMQQGVSNGNRTANSQIHSSTIGGTNFSAGAINPLTHAQLQSYYNADLPPTKPLESSGIRVGEIIAYRMWQLSGDYLQSYSMDRIWAPLEAMTGEPSDHGDEGIWAFKEKNRAIYKMLQGANTVYGSVKLWGKIIEHELGYRAEYAKIVSIDDLSKDITKKEKYGILETLRKNYQLV